jgi:hypothetical protein
MNMSRCSDRYGKPNLDVWGIDIIGACGELAVAKALGRYWSGALGNHHKSDVGPYQVRTAAARPTTPRLIIHHDDSDEMWFVMAVANPPVVDILGVLLANQGKKEKWWVDPTCKARPAYFVPANELKPLSTLQA